MLCSKHLCTFIEEIFIINLYGTDEQKKILDDFIKTRDGKSLKKIVSIANLLKKRG
ncbi:MAG: hypothetical protein M0R46_05125 [Candidatus Muirbacterium halophilum]|nr:hypothetical protein [Candidatus Muirbacterium halophilum]MCK9475277.1 hypothetical protein [Candidatus Muirbacterium halophilum]